MKGVIFSYIDLYGLYYLVLPGGHHLMLKWKPSSTAGGTPPKLARQIT